MLNQFCTTPHEVDIAFAVLGVALIAVAIGKGGGKLLLAVLKRWAGRGEVNVNNIIGETGGDVGDMPKRGGVCDPDKCTALVKIKEQQQRNISDIGKVEGEIHGLTELFFKKLTFIQQQNAVILRAMVKNNQLLESDIPKEMV